MLCEERPDILSMALVYDKIDPQKCLHSYENVQIFLFSDGWSSKDFVKQLTSYGSLGTGMVLAIEEDYLQIHRCDTYLKCTNS